MAKLIVGLKGAVCTDCIDLCNDILCHDSRSKTHPGQTGGDATNSPEVAPEVWDKIDQIDEEILRLSSERIRLTREMRESPGLD